MPFDAAKDPSARDPFQRQRIAVIGSGISGLSSAWLLSQSHDVVLYEKENRLGGHTNTVDIDLPSGKIPVDTGFIVFNEPAYPNFTAFLQHLGVADEESCMSFAVSMENGNMEYSGRTLSGVFANRRNAASPTFWKMLTDIPKFHRDAGEALRNGFCAHASLGEFVQQKGYGRGFSEHFLKPMAAAIWSTPQMKTFDYPALSFLKFFDNHGLLRVLNLPEWRTVSNGSRNYIDAIESRWSVETRLSSAVIGVERTDSGVVVRDVQGRADSFDQVVLASHANEAAKMLKDATPREASILSSFTYQPNRAVLHMDETHMPIRKRAWSSWNYLGDEHDGAVTYWMNQLQNLPCRENIFVTLNPNKDVAADKLIAEFSYDHPMFDSNTARAQKDIWQVQGNGGVWYAGAHLGHGFHEDGLQAGLAVAEALGSVRRPWSVADESGRLYAATPVMAAA